MGPQAGAGGGTVIAEGTPQTLAENPASLIGQFLHDGYDSAVRQRAQKAQMFALGKRSKIVDPVVRHDQKSEFGQIISYYGNIDYGLMSQIKTS